MKKIFTLILLFSALTTAYGQQVDRFRFQMDLGVAAPVGGGVGGIVNLEPQILVMDNMAVGIRLGFAGLAKDITYYSIPEDYTGEISGNTSFATTVNYYFNKGKSRTAPYLGAGFGYYAFSNIDIDQTGLDPDDIGDLKASFAWSPMVRAGVELNKFRLGVEYNFVPKSDLQNVNGDIIGEATNQYFGFTVGFFVGGGKWGSTGNF